MSCSVCTNRSSIVLMDFEKIPMVRTPWPMITRGSRIGHPAKRQSNVVLRERFRTGPSGSAGSGRNRGWPIDDALEQLLEGEILLGPGHPVAHGDAGFVHRRRVPGDERMPPVEVPPLREEPIG